MTTNDVRSRIQQFYQAMNAQDVSGILECYGPGAEIEVCAPGPFVGRQEPAAKTLEMLFTAIPELEFTVDGIVVEDNRAAVEVRSVGKFASGSPYTNRYHNFFEFQDGRIVRFREYPTYPAGAE